MENITSPRRGRPRKTVDVPIPVAEGESADCVNTGDGQVSGTGATAQTEPVRQGEGWDSFLARLSNPALRTVWHPEPKTTIIQRDHAAHLACLVGPIKGQINTGEFVEI